MSEEEKPEIPIGQERSASVAFSRRDLILYALGVGCSDLRFTYENHEKFAAFPTYPLVLAFKGEDTDVVSFPSPAMMETNVVPPLPGTRVVLDGERCLELMHPLPAAGGRFVLKQRLLGVHRKGKGALIDTEQLLVDESSGKVYARIVSGAFLVGAKGFDDAGSSQSENVKEPSRAPDAVVESRTLEWQALLYRLSGDYNPLHADPEFATMSGFPKPILHGLCTYGHAANAVLKTFAGSDPSLFRKIRGRFAAPVFPGETLATEMWREGNRVYFVVKAKERNVVVVSNAYVELHESPLKSSL